jgi:hypothetical protein
MISQNIEKDLQTLYEWYKEARDWPQGIVGR